MTKREAQELKMGLSTPFGRWVMTHMTSEGKQILQNSIEQIPQSLGEQIEREQNFGRSKALTEIVSQIPNTIDDLIKSGTS